MRQPTSHGIFDRFFSAVNFLANKNEDIDVERLDLSNISNDDFIYAIYDGISQATLVGQPKRFEYETKNFYDLNEGNYTFECVSEEREAPFGRIVKAYSPGISFPQFKNEEINYRVGRLFFELVKPLGFVGPDNHRVFYDTVNKKSAMPFVSFERIQDAEYNLKRMIDCYVDNKDALEAIYVEIENAQLPINRKSRPVGDERWQEVVGKFVDEDDFFRYRAGNKRSHNKKAGLNIRKR